MRAVLPVVGVAAVDDSGTGQHHVIDRIGGPNT